jgi:hypothetical protein
MAGIIVEKKKEAVTSMRHLAGRCRRDSIWQKKLLPRLIQAGVIVN